MAFVPRSCILWQGRQLLPPCNMPPRRGGVYDTEEQRNTLEHFLKGLRRCGFLPADFQSFEALATEADLKLFKSINSNPFHVLRHYLRQREPIGYGLRPRAHGFALPAKDDRNFIPRLLYGVLTNPN